MLHCFVIDGTQFGIPEIEFGLFRCMAYAKTRSFPKNFCVKIEVMPVRASSMLREWQQYFTLTTAAALPDALQAFKAKPKSGASRKTKTALESDIVPLTEALYRKLSIDFAFTNYEWRTKRPWILVWTLLRDKMGAQRSCIIRM